MIISAIHIIVTSAILSSSHPGYSGLKEMCMIQTESDTSHFLMDETPVTYTDFEKYVRAGGQVNAYWYYDSYHIAEQPVTGISWHQAIDYCNWRSKCEGFEPAYVKTGKYDLWGYPVYELSPTANGFRLPTSQQFEYAARAGKKAMKFPWGNEFVDSLANYDTDRGFKSAVWWRLAPVKSQYKNDFGLYNMCGNNWHWCDDWVNGELKSKRLKGGSWGSVSPDFMTNSSSSFSSPGNYNYHIGFRCVLPALSVPFHQNKIDTTVKHSFYKTIVSNPIEPITDFYSADFKSRLTQFIADNYPDCIYFQMQIDQEQILSPEKIASIIISVCQKNNINPLFLTSIMVSESGFGTVSFPRWYNNPMAYNWQNKLMVNGLPVYEALPGKKNRKFRTLADGFDAFCKGIRRDLYYRAAKTNLDAFHLIYVGYRADEWMLTMSRVYRDVAGVRFEPKFPEKDAGKYIYTDWLIIKKTIKP